MKSQIIQKKSLINVSTNSKKTKPNKKYKPFVACIINVSIVVFFKENITIGTDHPSTINNKNSALVYHW
jgi:hypothetical protein